MKSMEQNIYSTLKKYWGYDGFRPLQEDIINSIILGKDTLGLMPTGGGKSLTFQVPTMAINGLCIVITPLIALMKDQVENLKSKNIKAAAIYSGMSQRDIMITLDNVIFGAYNFLYISPERLSTEIFIDKLKSINVTLFAVDEAHCISQWGYDFRPSYLKISDIRVYKPTVPILALTATATDEVVDDIQNRLNFKEKNVFRKTFYRPNISYIVRKTDKKYDMLLKILKNVAGCGIVYVRNRKKTKEIKEFLVDNGISAENYHAGLKQITKDEIQESWKNDKTRIIVCTNAFGMGIDKPEVRVVVHFDLPDLIEAYFQEAGRAGRDEKKSYAVLIYSNIDKRLLEKRIEDTFPPKDKIKEIYNDLCNYYQIAVGYGLNTTHVFNLYDFCTKFKQSALIAFNSLKIIEQAGYIQLTDEQEKQSTVKIIVDRNELYNIKLNKIADSIIYILLRSYTGLFADPTKIDEVLISQRLNITTEELYEQLKLLSNNKIIKYRPKIKTPFIFFLNERVEIKELKIGVEAYDNRKKRYIKRIESMLKYANEENECRSKVLLKYFNEKDATDCGVCDICIQRKRNRIAETEFENIKEEISNQLKNREQNLNSLCNNIKLDEKKIVKTVRYMLDNDYICTNNRGEYRLNI